MAKKDRKTKEPEYLVSALNTPMLNYREYYMTGQEKLVTFLIAAAAGALVGMSFYGGLFPDEDGNATTATLISNIVVIVLSALIANLVYFPLRTKQLKKKRKALLTAQFRSLLDSMAVSISSGMNVSDAILKSRSDLVSEFSEESLIVKEVDELIRGVKNNIRIEEMMRFFGERSEINDIVNFASVFEICYRAGGNMKDIIRRTSNIISEKISINAEIETTLSSNKLQFSAMLVVPVVLVLLLRSMSSSFAASFATSAGVIANTVAIGIFVLAYKIGDKILKVKG